jgi:hypothetical protein
MPPVDGKGNGPSDRSTSTASIPPADSKPSNAEEDISSSPYHSSSPVSAKSLLPPRSFRPSDYSTLLAGTTQLKEAKSGEGPAKEVKTLSPYENLLQQLKGIADPLPSGGYDFQLENRNRRYRVFQEKDGNPIEVTVTQERIEKGGKTPLPVQLIQLTYLPDGKMQSSVVSTPHNLAQSGPELTHHKTLNVFLDERAARIKQGEALYFRLRTALEALNGRPALEAQSVWYDNFAVYGNSAYTFRKGLEDFPNPQLNQISIYADSVNETGAQRNHLANLSANGEINFQAQQKMKEPLSHAQINILNNIVSQLEEARAHPAAHEKELHLDLAKVMGKPGPRPKITKSVNIPRSSRTIQSPQGEIILELRSGGDLFKRSLPQIPLRWAKFLNLKNTTELRPRGRLKFWMNWEALRWASKWLGYRTFGNLSIPIRNAAERGDWVRVHLFPEGGGRLDIFREGHRHDVIVGGVGGPLWHARDEIKLLKGRVETPTPLEDLQAALARKSSDAPLPISLNLQDAPKINLDRFHLNPDNTPIEIRDAQTAWDLIQKEIPEGVLARVQSTTNETLLNIISPTEINHIKADLSHCQPPLNLEILHYDYPPDNPSVRRVEVTMRSGQNSSARVWENGTFRPDLARDVFSRELQIAQKGHVPLTWAGIGARGLQFYPRLYSFYKYNGLTYASSYFSALLLTMGYEQLLYKPGEKKLIGTPFPLHELSWSSFLKNGFWPFVKFSTSSGATSVGLDGLFNLYPGLMRTSRLWWNTNATLSQAYKLAGVSIYNPDPTIRPIGRTIFRGFLQRALPLFMGLASVEYFDKGRVNSPAFWHNALDVGMVTAGSATLLRAVYASETFSSLGMRSGLLKAAGAGSAESRFALTFWGSILVATLEMTALGIRNAHEKRALLKEAQAALGQELGQAIDRRNELITRLEHGEEIPPRQLMEADQELQQAQATYRHFLETVDKRQGTQHYDPLTITNDFQEEYDHLHHIQSFQDPLVKANLMMEHQGRLKMLKGRYEKMESELSELYKSYGVPRGSIPPQQESLKEFLNRQVKRLQDNPQLAEQVQEPSGGSSSHGTTSSPIAVESPEAELILKQFRWKAARDPAFVHWDQTRKAEYILTQFRAFQIKQTNGERRPWNRQDALAFLEAVDQANAKRAQNMEAPLTLPQEHEEQDTSRLNALLEAEAEIRKQEKSTHTHVSEHASRLADNVEDLDRQMSDYLRMTNERTAHALEKFIEPSLLAAR